VLTESFDHLILPALARGDHRVFNNRIFGLYVYVWTLPPAPKAKGEFLDLLEFRLVPKPESWDYRRKKVLEVVTFIRFAL
jgi:hypothetical protein